MVASNKLLDRFFLKVLQRLHPRADATDLSSSRRFCKLSIFTTKNTSNKTDSFFNSPHIDKMDVLFQDFQVAAKELLMELYRSNPDDEEVLKDIAYLQDLSYLCGGFSVPTTCGYDILHKEETSSDNVHAHFAMIGLGVTIKVCPHCYHYFFGSSFTHCTPAAISVNSNHFVSTFSDGDNHVIGWGGASSYRREIYDRFDGPPVPRMFPALFLNWILNANNPEALEMAELRGINI